MISLVLPYWQRKAAADAALERIGALYRGLDLEVIVVDDGSPEPYVPPKGLGVPVSVARLPAKTGPKNACVPFNVGAGLAQGDYIALSNVETLHRFPVLDELREEIQRGGPGTYAIAACWAPESGCWHAHSSIAAPFATDTQKRMPAGSHYHFLSMLGRGLWSAAGGFDEDYRAGAGYDDNDLLMRLYVSGARFVIRDDLVVDHPRAGARAAWTPEMFARNKALFLSKWA